MGKHKPTYAPHADRGDYVVVINAAQVALTGNKEKAKLYQWHTGWMGGLKTLTARQLRERKPERMVELAVKGMLPPNNLRDHRLHRLRIFPDQDHQYSSQIEQSIQYAKQHIKLHTPPDFTPRRQSENAVFSFDIDPNITPEELKKIQESSVPLETNDNVIKQHQKWQQKRVQKIHQYQKILDLHLLARAQEIDSQVTGLSKEELSKPMNLSEFLENQIKQQQQNTSKSTSSSSSSSTTINNKTTKTELR